MEKKSKLLVFMLGIFLLGSFSLHGQKSILAILDLKGEGISASEARIITGIIQEEMFKTGKYDLVERTRIEQLFEELEHKPSDFCDIQCAVKIGKQLSADKVMVGTIGKLGSLFTIQVKIVDIERSKIEKMESIRAKGDIGDLPDHLNKLIYDLTGSGHKYQDKAKIPSVKLRSTPKYLSYDDVRRIIKKYNFYCKRLGGKYPYNTNGDFENDYERKYINGDPVIIDKATGLIWHCCGSLSPKKKNGFPYAQMWVEDLNSKQYAGFNDWRLPTLEEGASILEKETNEKGVNCDSLFSFSSADRQWCFYTSDEGDYNPDHGKTVWTVWVVDGWIQASWNYSTRGKSKFFMAVRTNK